MFTIEKFLKGRLAARKQYANRLEALKKKGVQTNCIADAVHGASKNISNSGSKSFVIYGEPQSGKTEMMIALTAKLLDEGHSIIIHLLNDNVSLLDQNLQRFKASGLAPAPVNFKEIIDRSVKIDNRPFVIFCKKNQSDLIKLLDKLGKRPGIVIIDDEADYASPNAKINQGKASKINELILKLLGNAGTYIGVTATPARLDLNNTFDNRHEDWVSFKPHDRYTGQETFFPTSGAPKFALTLIPDTAGDAAKHCRDAFFKFLVNSAYLNLHPEINNGSNNYTFLMHTSGQKVDHKRDYQDIQTILAILGNDKNPKFEKYLGEIWSAAKDKFPGNEDEITQFIVDNILRHEIKVLNSDNDVLSKGTSPACPFTVIIGGNIISRGVTFDNLLSMFFTRDVKHKLQQDTYIQRARMFGARGSYLEYFELTIPENLYTDWQRCFVFHRLSLKSIEAGNGAPIWLSDRRIAAVASNSIDKANVSLDSGEMSYALFDYTKQKTKLENILRSSKRPIEKLATLQSTLGEQAFPAYLIEFIKDHSTETGDDILIHDAVSIASSGDADQEAISRKKGFMGGANFTGRPEIAHHLRIHFNAAGKARLFYKFAGRVSFLKNDKRKARSK